MSKNMDRFSNTLKFVHDFLYALLILSKYLKMIKIDRNTSGLQQIVFKYIILTLLHFLVLLCELFTHALIRITLKFLFDFQHTSIYSSPKLRNN
jgi:hypothetical protein